MDTIVPIFHSLTKNLNSIHKESSNGISIVQSSILHEISLGEKPSMQAVSDAVGMDITTFSRQINTLERKELVVKTPYPGDRRFYLLALTEKGRAITECINESISVEMGKVFESMNDFERDTIVRSMNMLEERLRTN
ncbi:MarR family winged helix-turn-helix transcriptional regulator [Filibacter tadaridae]|uniref:Transcriptional regulator SlyA n=1 Tax=Filibacter tadaridae TaxID=2483811 RepID=A0A3P5XC98_9BACL|nr:MarR family winged helix-turn-helix transcriptional regulator [Filibacter tadaridae]VDC28952.1 transcriptional regulator SlyA [Filibacter tadaridae]